ncbi:hypothetical protein BDA96_01G100100 [Sorghum bicolor]|uniref:CCHC-type domain-containing protein n=1 Tax=Sorghum bicolor TaxID=4558 RepID=A0A921RWU5_SORBI|nr:hypothetical protein BDA96_01G100100 [Sorghum bicolor]
MMGERAAPDNPGDRRVVAGTCYAEARSGGPPAPPPLNPPNAIAPFCLCPQTSSAKGPLTLTATHNSTKLTPLLPSPPPPTETHRHRRRRRRDLPKQLAADRKNNKSTKSARRKVVQVSVRPGIEFQSLVLRDLCSDVLTPEPSSNSGAFWITPPFRSPRFSAVSISNMLSFFLCAPPQRVSASAVEPSVFCARVAPENVAGFILARRELKLHNCIFTLHASLPAASAMAAQLREEEDFTPGHLPLPGETELSNSCAVLGARGGVDLKRLDVERSPNLATAPSDSTRSYDAPLPPVLSPAREQRGGDQSQGKEPMHAASSVSGPGQMKASINAAVNGSKPKTYAEALLSSGISTASGSDRGKGKRRPAPLVPPAVGCFRCLSSSHMVRDCRDPLRCRRCGGNGHRQFQCSMPVARRRQTPFTRHPASARHVRRPVPVNAAVPYVLRTLLPPAHG